MSWEWIIIIPFCFLIIRLSQDITKINIEKSKLIYKLEQLERTLDEVVRYQDDDRILLLSLNTRILRLEKKLYGKSMDGWLDQETGAMKRIQKEEETGNIQKELFTTIPTYRKTRARLFDLTSFEHS